MGTGFFGGWVSTPSGDAFAELGFGVWGLGLGAWGLGFGVWGLGFGVLGFGVWGLGFGVSRPYSGLRPFPPALVGWTASSVCLEPPPRLAIFVQDPTSHKLRASLFCERLEGIWVNGGPQSPTPRSLAAYR